MASEEKLKEKSQGSETQSSPNEQMGEENAPVLPHLIITITIEDLNLQKCFHMHSQRFHYFISKIFHSDEGKKNGVANRIFTLQTHTLYSYSTPTT